MKFLFMDSVLLVQLTLFACGIGWVITGSKIGRISRVVGYVCTAWIPKKPLTSLFFCPPCCTWWCGFGLGFWADLPWYSILQLSFTAAFIMAILNAQWQLDANDREEIERLLWRGDAPQEPSEPEESK